MIWSQTEQPWDSTPFNSGESQRGFRIQTFDRKLDGPRLDKQLDRVFAYLKDGKRRTLTEIANACNLSESSAGARFRDLKKERYAKEYGVKDTYRERDADIKGLHWYWLDAL